MMTFAVADWLDMQYVDEGLPEGIIVLNQDCRSLVREVGEGVPGQRRPL